MWCVLPLGLFLVLLRRSAGLDKVWAKGLRSLVATSKASFPAGVQDLPVRWGLRHLLRLLIAYLKAAGDRAARYWPVRAADVLWLNHPAAAVAAEGGCCEQMLHAAADRWLFMPVHPHKL